ncbi:hypothetical protein EDF62_2997 [Leucobacter luti]|uniref:phosphomannomutase n=1 Tax=Leucobacter luti TaxID=340320 RepID=A0A4R6RS79_9MICO|nr:HAD-IIB family hydrolase [Leucobacter luti]TDP89703.1 hypothetical protein EDF62_2997 [Leucobacter luti]
MSPLPRLVAFDLDDTLAPSKSPVEPRMLEVFARLLARTNVAVISGGNFEQFESQLLTRLAEATAASRAAGSAAGSASSASVIDEAALSRLHLLPTCGTRYERREHGAWATVYREHLSEVERDSALIALREEAARLGLWESEPWGEILEDRGSQVTFSALGQRAPVAAKHAWDPDGVKKNALRAAVAARLPELEVRSGGSTSVDITRRGIDKAYGMRKLEEHTGISLDEMLFVGDRLDPDGNDYPVLALGVTCHAVTGWEDTAAFLDELLRH